MTSRVHQVTLTHPHKSARFLPPRRTIEHYAHRRLILSRKRLENTICSVHIPQMVVSPEIGARSALARYTADSPHSWRETRWARLKTLNASLYLLDDSVAYLLPYFDHLSFRASISGPYLCFTHTPHYSPRAPNSARLFALLCLIH